MGLDQKGCVVSNPIAKAKRSKAKDIRQGLTDQRPVGTVSKRARPILVEYRIHPNCQFPFFRCWQKGWSNYKRYRTLQEAQKAISDHVRKHPNFYEFRIADQLSSPQPSVGVLPTNEHKALSLSKEPNTP
jgi:hypothetical protein